MMNRLRIFIGNRFKSILVKKNTNNIRRCFKCIKKENVGSGLNTEICNVINAKDYFTYKDNSWNHIKYIFYFMWNDLFRVQFLKINSSVFFENNSCEDRKINYFGNELRCYSSGEKNDWIFLKFTEKIDKPFRLSFEAKISSENSEFQLAFNYQNIGRRYRFNLINNKLLRFDVVGDGCFVNNICSTEFQLELGVYHRFELIADGPYYQYIVNDRVIMTVEEVVPCFSGDQLAFILWDSSGKTIDVSYQNIKLYSYENKDINFSYPDQLRGNTSSLCSSKAFENRIS